MLLTRGQASSHLPPPLQGLAACPSRSPSALAINACSHQEGLHAPSPPGRLVKLIPTHRESAGSPAVPGVPQERESSSTSLTAVPDELRAGLQALQGPRVTAAWPGGLGSRALTLAAGGRGRPHLQGPAEARGIAQGGWDLHTALTGPTSRCSSTIALHTGLQARASRNRRKPTETGGAGWGPGPGPGNHRCHGEDGEDALSRNGGTQKHSDQN